MRASLALKRRSTVAYSLFKLCIEIADQFLPDLKNNSPVNSHTNVQPQHADTSCFLNHTQSKIILNCWFSLSWIQVASRNQTIIRFSMLPNYAALCKQGLIKQQNTAPNVSKLCLPALKLGKMHWRHSRMSTAHKTVKM